MTKNITYNSTRTKRTMEGSDTFIALLFMFVLLNDSSIIWRCYWSRIFHEYLYINVFYVKNVWSEYTYWFQNELNVNEYDSKFQTIHRNILLTSKRKLCHLSATFQVCTILLLVFAVERIKADQIGANKRMFDHRWHGKKSNDSLVIFYENTYRGLRNESMQRPGSLCTFFEMRKSSVHATIRNLNLYLSRITNEGFYV